MADVMNGLLDNLETSAASILDSIDEAAGKGKLDLIIQLPYVIKSEARQKTGEKKRQAMIDEQLNNSPHGIVYTDGTEDYSSNQRPPRIIFWTRWFLSRNCTIECPPMSSRQGD